MSDPQERRDKLKRTAFELEKDMRRAECKGRTLCLKVKLHTFEVLTRQVVLPRAINTADDLYSFALPMLGKLEKEFPGMTLRLMGLRCTHLVSTKPPDTLSFFGLRRRPDSGESKPKATSGEEEWEQWPDEAVGDGQEAEEHLLESRKENSGAESPYRRHGKEIAPNPKKEDSVEDGLWDCPICGRPQPANERQFNDHIDLCLSRKTILDTVQQEAAIQPATSKAATPEASKKAIKKRSRQASTPDPKQKKLCFG
jgi:DNA polymerase kappa